MRPELTIAQRIRLLRRAVEEGLLTEADLDLPSGGMDVTLSEETVRQTCERLVAEGRLSADWLRQEQGSLFDSMVSNPSSGGLDLSTIPEDLWAAFPLPRAAGYAPLAFLGDGGMGKVFKAYDYKLNRAVALKFLKRLEQGPLDRFLTEGRAQAQIDHPHVCDIHSVGEVDGLPYLAMRFIDGPTLKAALPLLNLEQKVRVLKDVAEALHACHRLGIIHRDVKPGNIMLERREDGVWWPFVMDFGLARDLGTEGMTISGVIVGTPLYCSPEQVQGRMQDVDRRSDVYALGATLYECLCGQAPFPPQGSLVDLIRRIVEEEPEPLVERVPNLPRDLQTIVLKALEKDPSRRYDSARAFAEDLGRFLDGDPIQAHRATLAYRLAKRVRKHKGLTLALVAGALLFMGTGTLLVVRARTLALSAQRFGREAEQMETLLYKSYNRPLHDVREERAMVLARLRSLQAELARQGRWSQAAGRLALGRGYLGLDMLEEARMELERARRAAPADPEVAYALGLALARQYQQEVEGLRGKALEDRRKELEGSLRGPALACLRQAREADAFGPGAEGVLALVEERYEDALRGSRQLQRLAPWNHEAWLLEADVHKALAGRSLSRGAFQDAEERLGRAGEALLQARTLARSAPSAYVSEVQRRMMVYQLRMDRGKVSEADRDWTLEAADLALQADPDSWRTLSYVAAIHRRWGAELLNRGEDPTPALEKAIEAARGGLRVHPTDNPLWNNLGTALRNLAAWEAGRGEDPTATLARAVEALQAGLARPQFKDWLLNNLGNAWFQWANWRASHGQDPGPEAEKALACLAEAKALRPWVGHDVSLGAVLDLLGQYDQAQGRDPQPRWQQAAAAYEAGLQLNPNSYQAHETLAQNLLQRVEARLDRGAFLRPELEQALRHLEETRRLNPRLGGLVQAWTARARALQARAGDTSALRTGRADLLGIQEAMAGQGELQTALAEGALALVKAGAGPEAAAAGLRVLDQALRERPWQAYAHYLRGALLCRTGRRTEGEASLRRAVELDANLARLAKAAAGP